MVENILRLAVAENGGVAIRAHSACVRSAVAIEHRFVVLRGGQRHHVAPVAQGDETHFLAAQEFFDHHAAAQPAERLFGLRAVLGHHHAFTRRQAIGLQHHRESEAANRFARIRFVFDGHERGRGDVSLHKEVLGEDLAAFQLRRFPVRSHDAPAGRAERIHHTGHQRNFRSDHR